MLIIILYYKNKKIKLSDLTPKENEPQDVFEIGKRNNMITSYKFSNINLQKETILKNNINYRLSRFIDGYW